MMSDRLLNDVRRSNAAVAKTTNQVTSGSRIQTAADDPTGARKALRLRADLAENEANQAGVDTATAWTTQGESALASVNDIVNRTRELVISAGNDTLSASDRAGIAKELTQLLDQVKSAANAKSGDSYVFAGQQSNTAPYQMGTNDSYAGDTGAVTRTIGPGVSVQVNVPGSSIFGGVAGDGKLIDTMRQAIANLNSGTAAGVTALRTTTLTSLQTNLDDVIAARTTLGATQARTELAGDRLKDVNVTLNEQLTNIEGTDMAAALTTLSTQKTAYQASLQAGARVIQQSLMDFLS
jgi:flagellar hook-associated protein 3 FlgL